MIISEPKRKEFNALMEPVMQWLRDNCHPHCHITVDSERAELSEGICATVREKHEETATDIITHDEKGRRV